MNYLDKDLFANYLGIKLKQADKQNMVCTLQLNDTFFNGLGGVHGAILFALADITFAAACNFDGRIAIGIQADIKYLNKVAGQTLTARATQLSCSNKLSNYQVSIRDEHNTDIALFSATAYRLQARI